MTRLVLEPGTYCVRMRRILMSIERERALKIALLRTSALCFIDNDVYTHKSVVKQCVACILLKQPRIEA